MRLPIYLQREIVRLHFHSPNESTRAIARSLGIAPGTVQSMRASLEKCGLPWSQLRELDDDAWVEALGNRDRSVAQRKEAPEWSDVHEQMQRPNATLEQLWREWREVKPQGIGYSQFTDGYRKWIKKQKLSMRQVHVPGRKLFSDYAGSTIEIHDRHGGPARFAQIFVAALGYSKLAYVEATETQSTPDWIRAHANCFEVMGGAPEWVVCDNLKAAVWRRERDHIVINPAFRECLKHYDCAPFPAGPRKPKHKAIAEVSVQIVQRWILFALRDQVFFSLEELNDALRVRMIQFNTRPFKKIPGCRQELFDASEKHLLKPLPPTPYELADWRYQVLVGEDYHVEHQGSFYSVPHALVRERVDLRFSATGLEVFRRGRRVAMHALLDEPGSSSTIDSHRPLNHVRALDGEPQALMSWAKQAGGCIATMIEHHLTDRRDRVNGVKAAQRIRELTRTHGQDRIEEVCAYALRHNFKTLRSFLTILRVNADQRDVSVSPVAHFAQGEVRGSQYYGDVQ